MLLSDTETRGSGIVRQRYGSVKPSRHRATADSARCSACCAQLAHELMKAVQALPALGFIAGQEVFDRLKLVVQIGVPSRRDDLYIFLCAAALGGNRGLQIVDDARGHRPHRSDVAVV